MLMSNKFVWFYFRSHYSKLDFAISLESKSGREKNVSPHYLTLSLQIADITEKSACSLELNTLSCLCSQELCLFITPNVIMIFIIKSFINQVLTKKC